MKSKILKFHAKFMKFCNRISYEPGMTAFFLYFLILILIFSISVIAYNAYSNKNETHKPYTNDMVYGSAMSERNKYKIEYMFTIDGYKYYKAVDGDVTLYICCESINSISK